MMLDPFLETDKLRIYEFPNRTNFTADFIDFWYRDTYKVDLRLAFSRFFPLRLSAVAYGNVLRLNSVRSLLAERLRERIALKDCRVYKIRLIRERRESASLFLRSSCQYFIMEYKKGKYSE